MTTDKRTLEALQNIAEKLKEIGVKSEDLKILNMHIGQQGRQIGWEWKNGKWVYRKDWKYGKKQSRTTLPKK